MKGPRQDLQERLESPLCSVTPLETPVISHELYNMNDDKALSMMRAIGLDNNPNSRVKVIFVPCYLNGNDGIFNMPYYDLLPGDDLAVYPSYYEPWGYTPLESVAFHVPTITTDLAGFGLWVNSLKGEYGQLEDGVKVVHRTDSNWDDAANEIKNTILTFTKMDDKQVADLRRRAAAIAKKALWDKFVKYYLEAYEVALSKVNE